MAAIFYTTDGSEAARLQIHVFRQQLLADAGTLPCICITAVNADPVLTDLAPIRVLDVRHDCRLAQADDFDNAVFTGIFRDQYIRAELTDMPEEVRAEMKTDTCLIRHLMNLTLPDFSAQEKNTVDGKSSTCPADTIGGKGQAGPADAAGSKGLADRPRGNVIDGKDLAEDLFAALDLPLPEEALARADEEGPDDGLAPVLKDRGALADASESTGPQDDMDGIVCAFRIDEPLDRERTFLSEAYRQLVRTCADKDRQEADADSRSRRRQEPDAGTRARRMMTGSSGTPHGTVRGAIMEKIGAFLDAWTPAKIKAYLDKYVIAQEDAKRAVSIVFYEHLYRIAHPERKGPKDNLLMVGPSGCGKTEILRVLQDISPICICFFNAAGMSQEGFTGDKKVSSILDVLGRSADLLLHRMTMKKNLSLSREDLKWACENSLVFLDEFDKAVMPNHSSRGENVAANIMAEMLKLFEDGVYTTGGARGRSLDCRNVLFVCAGAFASLTQREAVKKALGFGAVTKEEGPVRRVTSEDLIRFGMTYELTGRIPVIATLQPLTVDDMVAIIKNPHAPVAKDYLADLYTIYGIEAELSDEGCRSIAERVLDLKTGARGVRSILMELKEDIVWNTQPGEQVVIDACDGWHKTAAEHLACS